VEQESAALDCLVNAAIAAGDDDGRAEDERDALYAGFMKVEDTFIDANNRLFHQIRRAQAPAAAAAATAPTAGNQTSFRKAKALTPRELHCTDTHVALHEWVASCRCYYDASKFVQATDAIRHQFFYACLEYKLARRVRTAAMATSAILNPENGDPDPTLLETLLRTEFDMI
jgi:hypothetical protein